MACRRFLPLVVGVVLTVASKGVRAEAPLRLEDAVRAALHTNERALKAPYRVAVAEAQLARARAGFLPTLVASAQANVTRSTAEAGRPLAGVGTVTLTQPIVNPSAFPLYA